MIDLLFPFGLSLSKPRSSFPPLKKKDGPSTSSGRAELWIAVSLLLTFPAPALAEALHCPLPREVPRPFVERVPDDREPVVKPVTGYILALSWSPDYCAQRRNAPRDALQCRDGRFGFVLHGLWPQGEGTEPAWCAFAPRLPEALIRANLCVSPSAQLIQHQWAKHGTCSGASARGYLAASRTLYGKLRFPTLPRATTAGAVRIAFARANPWLPRAAVSVQVGEGKLSGVRLCLDTQLKPARCIGRANDRRRITIAAAARR